MPYSDKSARNGTRYDLNFKETGKVGLPALKRAE
jgi:hypothetical protein